MSSGVGLDFKDSKYFFFYERKFFLKILYKFIYEIEIVIFYKILILVEMFMFYFFEGGKKDKIK